MTRALAILLFLTPAVTAAQAQAPTQPTLKMELEKTSAIPGQPLIMRVTILVPTWMPKAPVYPSFEVPNTIVRLPPRGSRPTSKRIGRETWSGVTRAYRLYPMTVGMFRLPPLPLIVTYAHADTRKPVKVVLRTNPVEFAGTVPEGAEDLDPFIGAETLILEQTIEGDPGALEPGGAVTRKIKVTVTGTSPIFVPGLINSFVADGLAAYPKEPVVTESSEGGVLSGDRIESVTYVAAAGGRHSAPAIRLRWYNLKTKQIETTQAPGFEIAVSGPPPVKPSTFDWQEAVPRIALGVMMLALACLLAVRLRPHIAAWSRRRREAYLASEAFAYNSAMQALKARRFPDALRGVAVWSSRMPPAPDANDAELAEAMAALGSEIYGKTPDAPTPRLWATALGALRATRRTHLRVNDAKRASGSLPELNPGQRP